MCVACVLGSSRKRFTTELWWKDADNGTLVLVCLGPVAFSIGLQRVRPWFKPERHRTEGVVYGFSSSSKKAILYNVPRKTGVMWGVFHFVWESEVPIQLGITR